MKAGRVLMSLAGALAAALLAGCGFTPLYATPGVGPGLSSIEVAAPKGRVGYLLREELDDALARDKTVAPNWRLDLEVTQTRDPYGLRRDDVAERYELGLQVRYILTELSSGKVAHSGVVTSHVSYDAADQPYAGIAARQDSQQRAAWDAARKIHLDLIAWMAGGKEAVTAQNAAQSAP
jgi:LPS-assembly lipoprotein